MPLAVRCEATAGHVDVPGVAVEIRLPATVGDLVRAAVREQLAALRIRRDREARHSVAALARLYLSDAEVAEQACAGKVAMPDAVRLPELADEDAAVSAALRALARGWLAVLVDGEVLRDPRACVPPAAREAIFLRLVPLAGG